MDKQKSPKPNFNYFLMFPLTDETFLSKYTEIHSNIQSQNIPNFNINLLQHPKRFHITIIVLSLTTPSEIQTVIDILNTNTQSIQDIIEDPHSLSITFDSFSSFQTDLTNARVVYLKPLEDENHYKLSEITHLLITELINHGIINKNDLLNYKVTRKEGKYVTQPHSTFLNVSFLPKQEHVHSFNAVDVMKYLNTLSLPSCAITKIHLCKMRKNNNNNEEYEVVHSINI